MLDMEIIKPKAERNLKWQELTIRIEHYKYYLNMALQVNVFFYLVTGGVLGFYLKDPDKSAKPPMEFVLLLPILIGSIFGGVFIYGARLQEKALDGIEQVREELFDRLGLGIEQLHDAHLLHILLRIFGYIFFAVGVAMVIVPFVFAGASKEWPVWGDRVVYSKWFFLVVASVILGLGGLMPVFARWIDYRLKERRKEKWLDRIGAWVAEIRKMEQDDISALKAHPSYREWLLHIGNKTVESIKDGTFKTEFLIEDINKLKDKWEQKQTRTETKGWWQWLTVA
jgi:hypothetical protein